jgi:hypothetical protein
MDCIDANFNDQGGIFQHFSSSRRKIRRKRLKTPEIARNLRTKNWEILKNLMRKMLMHFSIFTILGVLNILVF